MRSGVVIRDSEFNITYANQAVCDLLGRSREDLIGLNLADLLEPGQFQKVLKSVKQQSESGVLETYVLSFIGKDGRRLKAEVTPQPELAAEGLPDAKFAIIRELGD
jgi:PAS domain S-box-containing protein